MNRRAIRLIVCIISCSLFSGCDGGLVGTGTGPTSVPDVPRLPRKISPYLPDTIKNNSLQSSDGMQLADTSANTGMATQPQTEAKSWSLISPSLQELDTTRIAVQEMLVLLEFEFDNIVANCLHHFAVSPLCIIDSGQIVSTYNDAVTEQMIAVHTTANADTPANSIVVDANAIALREYYEAQEGTELVFNELTLGLPAAGSNSFTLIISSDDVLQGDEVRLTWSNTHNQIDYDVSDKANSRQVDRYNYQNNVSGQRLTVRRDQSGDNGTLVSSSFEFTTDSADDGDIYYNARIENYHISGQANDQSAFAYNRTYEPEEDDFYYSQEVFDEDGYLIVFDECEELNEFYCDEFEKENELYELYISPDDLENAYSELGFSEVYISRLPAGVREFLIVENEPDVPLWLRDEYCDGWQPFPGEVELFCFVHNEDLEDAVVVSADGDELELLPDTEVIVEYYSD